MKKVLVYSHDTFGLGNVRRMLAICGQLVESIPGASVLLVTGSPVVHSFRLPPRLDYLKLPCVTRTHREQYAPKYLGMDSHDMAAMRSGLISSAVADFRPDVVLVDKKPLGVQNELEGALGYLRRHLPATRLVLVLRDILDDPTATMAAWEKQGAHDAIRAWYDRVLVLGTPSVFDAVREYQFPRAVAEKVEYCGYIRSPSGRRTRSEVRRALGVPDERPLVLVTAGGGEDGHRLLDTYISTLGQLPGSLGIHSLLVTGPELPAERRSRVMEAAAEHPRVNVIEFTDDMMGCMAAADVVVSMGGYNTVCEILSAGKRAVIVPRVRPVAEQHIRAERLARLGLISTIHPDDLEPRRLLDAVRGELSADEAGRIAGRVIDLGALSRAAACVDGLLEQAVQERGRNHLVRMPLHAEPRRTIGARRRAGYLGSLPLSAAL